MKTTILVILALISCFSYVELRRPISLKQAIRMVEMANYKVCVGRTICELSCDRSLYGTPGRRLYSRLRRFRTGAPDVDPSQLEYYVSAEKNGISVRPDCSRCGAHFYIGCDTGPQELIRFGNHLEIK